MTKAELLTYLEGLDFVELLIKLDNRSVGLPANLQFYKQTFLESYENIAIESTVYFYVKNEGFPEEEAFFSGGMPKSKIHPTHWLADKYKAQIDQRHGKVISTGEDWIIVEGYIDASGDMVRKLWFVKEVDGVPTIKVVTG